MVFFELLDDLHPKVFRRLCHDAIETMWMAPQEKLFDTNEEATAMFFISSGNFNYTYLSQLGAQACARPSANPKQIAAKLANETGRVPPLVEREVSQGQWLCEAALWVDWEHLGELLTITDACALTMKTAKFHHVIKANTAAHAIAVLYARRFLDVMNCFGKSYFDFIPEGMLVNVEALGSEWRNPEEPTE